MNPDFRMLGGADPWKMLGVGRGASQDEIRRAYRAKVRRTHPDAGGSHDEHTKVERALAVLSDPVRMASYRALLDKPTSRPTSQPTSRPTDQPRRPAPRPSQPAGGYQRQSGPAQRRTATGDGPLPPFPTGVYESRLASRGINRLAMASLPAALFCGPVGVVMAIIALRRISRTGERGAACAWIAIVLSVAVTVVATISPGSFSN